MTTYVQIERMLNSDNPDTYSFWPHSGLCIEQERFNGRVYLSTFIKLNIIKFFI